MPYMQLFKLHLIRVFSQKKLANVKNGQKTVIFALKIMFCEILTKILPEKCQMIQGHYFDPKTTQIANSKKNRSKLCVWRLKHRFYMVFRVSNPEMARKPKKSRKLMPISDDKKSYMARLILMRQVQPCLTLSNLVNLAVCYSQIRKFDCFGRPIARFNRTMDRFWIWTCLTQTNPNPKLGVRPSDSKRFREKTPILASFAPNREKKIALLATRRSGRENTRIRSASQYNPQVPQENIPKKACLQSMQANYGFPIEKPKKTEKYVFQDRKFMS